jgi:hypothetical protein
VLTLANTSAQTVRVSLALVRDGDDGGATVTLAGAPRNRAIAPGATLPIALTLRAHDLPQESAVVGGWLLVTTGSGSTLRVPWAMARSDDLAAGLIGAAALVPPRVAPKASGPPPARLTLVLGSARSNGTARLEIVPVQRLSVDLYRDAQLLGRLVERQSVLPGRYRYGISGLDPRSGRPLAPGIYKLVVDAVSPDGVTSERRLGFTVTRP